jgi:SsrA-binding protein
MTGRFGKLILISKKMKPVKNRKAFFDYDVLETLEVGVVLEGHEVKSARQGGFSLKDSYVIVKDEEFFLLNASISRYKYMSGDEYDPNRTRKLLASKKQIISWASKMKQGNLTIVPLKAYAKGKNIKVEIGLARGKKKYEKKEALKKRELDRQLHREKREHMV